MSADAYLQQVLNREAVDTGIFSPVRAVLLAPTRLPSRLTTGIQYRFLEHQIARYCRTRSKKYTQTPSQWLVCIGGMGM